MKEGAIDLPGILEDAVVPLDALDAKLRWRIEPRAPPNRRCRCSQLPRGARQRGCARRTQRQLEDGQR